MATQTRISACVCVCVSATECDAEIVRKFKSHFTKRISIKTTTIWPGGQTICTIRMTETTTRPSPIQSVFTTTRPPFHPHVVRMHPISSLSLSPLLCLPSATQRPFRKIAEKNRQTRLKWLSADTIVHKFYARYDLFSRKHLYFDLLGKSSRMSSIHQGRKWFGTMHHAKGHNNIVAIWMRCASIQMPDLIDIAWRR